MIVRYHARPLLHWRPLTGALSPTQSPRVTQTDTNPSLPADDPGQRAHGIQGSDRVVGDHGHPLRAASTLNAGKLALVRYAPGHLEEGMTIQTDPQYWGHEAQTRPQQITSRPLQGSIRCVSRHRSSRWCQKFRELAMADKTPHFQPKTLLFAWRSGIAADHPSGAITDCPCTSFDS